MSAKKENAAIAGVGVGACAVCCAGPILGVLAAIGLGTAAAFAMVGAFAIVIGLVVVAFVVRRRSRRDTTSCVEATPSSVPIELSLTRSPP